MIEFYISWKQRNKHEIPSPSWIKVEQVKMHNPEVLAEYLLKKIKWPKSY